MSKLPPISMSKLSQLLSTICNSGSNEGVRHVTPVTDGQVLEWTIPNAKTLFNQWSERGSRSVADAVESPVHEAFGVQWYLKMTRRDADECGIFLYRINNWDSDSFRFNWAVYSTRLPFEPLINLREFRPASDEMDNWGSTRSVSDVKTHIGADEALQLKIVIQYASLSKSTRKSKTNNDTPAILCALKRFVKTPEVLDLAIRCGRVHPKKTAENKAKLPRDDDKPDVVRASKMLLCNASPVLEAMFYGKSPTCDELDLSGKYNANIVSALVKYSFGSPATEWGKEHIQTANDALSLFGLAMLYQIMELADVASDLFASRLCDANDIRTACGALRLIQPYLELGCVDGGKRITEPQPHKWAVGDEVLAPWREHPDPYPARITEIQSDGSVHVQFTSDGVRSVVDARRLKLKPNQTPSQSLAFDQVIAMAEKKSKRIESIQELQVKCAQRIAVVARNFLSKNIDRMAELAYEVADT